MIFIDSSSFIKHYVAEEGTAEVNALLSSSSEIFVAWLSLSECLAALARLERQKLLTREEFGVTKKNFLEDWERLRIVRETAELEPIVIRLIGKHPLRGADAVQLASAVYLREYDLPVTFVCSDRQLANMALEEGFKTETPGAA
ncbi:MAG TPA: type II toxin-antitoxin system VapC family toxin [Bdellovibrionota bacterium]|nr:type II toxin-antitoxin system VapC family toxin [Bdellovibrionota bacterium]